MKDIQSRQIEKPIISVIMPVYNTERFVGEAIESILHQSFQDFECIIIDDASTDSSYQICESYAKKDQRIRLYRNEENMGISYTRNSLIRLSKTNYIVSQDSDDISLPERLQKEYVFLNENKDYGAVSGNNIIIDEIGKEIGRRIYAHNIKSTILKKSPISQPGSMFRKDIFLELGGYDNQLNYGEDYDLWLRMYSNGYKLKNINENVLKYRIRTGQTKTERLVETIKNTIFIQDRAIKNYALIPRFSDRIYHIFEKLLLFFPSSFIIFLFTKIEYKNVK